MIDLRNINNTHYYSTKKFDLIYADMIYENTNLNWIEYWLTYLKVNGLFIVQTDWHTSWRVRSFIETEFLHMKFVNTMVWKNEWGNHPKRKFHQCYDEIIIYSFGEDYKFYPDRVQVDKVTKNKGLNPSGRQTKTATCWIDDICLTTTSKERVKLPDGHLIRWQKPIRLFDRIVLPFTDEGDSVADIFAGSMSLGEWCIKNNRNYLGIEIDSNVFSIGKERLEKVEKAV